MTFTQEEIGEAGKALPVGHYPAKLLDVQIVDPKTPNGAGAILAIFEILKGDYTGETLRIYRRLDVYATKKGAWFAPGLQEMKADLVAAKGLEPGVPLTRDPDGARQLFAKGLRRKELDLLVYLETYKDKEGESKTITKVKVASLLNAPAAAQAANDLV
jgi:hypothetical protein